ncbi:MAG: tRNA lysidine(34) synthetase TilS [Clostridia bacterium]|nr:tRNA lysidine(34) synthetase TilS [Clostridia bacterium]
MKLLNTLSDTVKSHNMIKKGDRVLVALSGGADSVTLLHMLYEISETYGFSVGAAHVNHKLRDTADRDMNFCKNLCEKLNIPLEILVCDIRNEAKANGMSEELYARGVRYDFFNSLGYDKIATAHNKNDNAETILFNFMRGSSLSGLCGIPYMRDNIIRPLLDIKKADIISYCKENGYDFVTDETNFREIYTRNKIRLSLIPQIEDNFNENFVNTVTENSNLIAYDSDFLDTEAKKLFRGEVSADLAKGMHPAMLFRIIQLYYKEKTGAFQNLSVSFVKAIVSLLEKNKTGSQVDLPNGFYAYISYGKLIIEKKAQKLEFEYDIFPNMPLFISEIGKIVTLVPDKNGKIFLENENGLKIRNKRNGDVFYPTGMAGKKRLSDYFTDKKIPQKLRNTIPILTKNDDIVSIIGYRNDRRFTDTSYAPYSISVKEAENAK